MGSSIPLEKFLLSDNFDLEWKINRLAEGKVKIDPFSSSRDIFMFCDFKSDSPPIYLFPKYSFINDYNFYVGMYSRMVAKNMTALSLNLQQGQNDQ